MHPSRHIGRAIIRPGSLGYLATIAIATFAILMVAGARPASADHLGDECGSPLTLAEGESCWLWPGTDLDDIDVDVLTAGVYRVEAWGGGGGGGGGLSLAVYAGGGGGAGDWVGVDLDLDLADVITWSIGAGGAGGSGAVSTPGAGNNGDAGGETVATVTRTAGAVTLTSAGGAGGAGAVCTGAEFGFCTAGASGAGGAGGGSGGPTDVTGDLVEFSAANEDDNQGGDGGPGAGGFITGGGGGGGGAAGPDGDGGEGEVGGVTIGGGIGDVIFGGAGGDGNDPGGDGGDGGIFPIFPGGEGAHPGGGGGGGGDGSGAAGGYGAIRITLLELTSWQPVITKTGLEDDEDFTWEIEIDNDPPDSSDQEALNLEVALTDPDVNLIGWWGDGRDCNQVGDVITCPVSANDELRIRVWRDGPEELTCDSQFDANSITQVRARFDAGAGLGDPVDLGPGPQDVEAEVHRGEGACIENPEDFFPPQLDDVTPTPTPTPSAESGGCPAPAVPAGTFSPAPVADGLMIATWGGGNVDALPAATSFWTTIDGELVGYIPGAPAWVNEAFLAAFPGGEIPACQPFIVVRAP